MSEPANPPPVHVFDPRVRVPALDGIRGIAILLVLLHHFSIYGGMRPTVIVDKLFYRVATAAWCGVDLFFVLSGSLITCILLDAKGSDYFFRNFYVRRVLRIFPLYYGFLVAFFVVLPHTMPVGEDFRLLMREQGWYWSYLVNLPIAFEGWPPFHALGHFWSLAVEEQFYLFWPVVVFLCRRRTLMIMCLGCIVGSFGVRLGLALAGYPLAAYVLTPARMDTLAIGAFLALVVRRPASLLSLWRWMWPVAGASAAALATIFVWRRGLGSTDVIVQTIGYTLLAVLFGALLSIAVTSPHRTVLGRVFAHPVLLFFGRYSYALYVFHHPIALFMGRSLLGESGMPTFFGSQLPALALFFMAATGISLSFALLSWHFYEVHFLRLKALFPYAPNKDPLESARCGVTPAPSS